MTDMIDLTAVWTAATDEVAETIASAQQRAYLRLTRLYALFEDTALVSVPDTFTRDMIESRMRPAITEALSRRLGYPVQVAVTLRQPEEAAPAEPGIPAPREPGALFDRPQPGDGWSSAPSGSAVAEHPVDRRPHNPGPPPPPPGPAPTGSAMTGSAMPASTVTG